MPDKSTRGPIALRNVSFVYTNGLRAVAPVNLDIREGEFVSSLGPSGCGKRISDKGPG